ncbi:MAG: hypothetical protein RCG15_03640 [Candidatus Rickettsia vulgarisii]
MAIGILHHWDYLAFHNDINIKYGDRNDSYLDKIINKFENGTIKTEKLHTESNLFSFRLNEKERVVCTVTKHQDKECLVVLDILPNHEYHKSKYIKGTSNVTLNNESINIVAAIEEELTNATNEEQKYKELPKIYNANAHNKTIILRKRAIRGFRK